MSTLSPHFESSRPYRSHKQPACSSCRSRKSRCTVDQPGFACLLCRVNGSPCSLDARDGDTNTQHIEEPRTCSAPTVERLAKRPRRDASELGTIDAGSTLSRSSVPVIATLGETSDHSSHIVGPALAQDAQALEGYISSLKGGRTRTRPNPYNLYSSNPTMPILYMTVDRRHNYTKAEAIRSSAWGETMERLVEPYESELVDLYFEHINPCFPVLDEIPFKHYHQHERSRLPVALLCNVYAISAIYWQHSPVAKPHPRPNIRYMWNLATKALSDDYHSPGLSTVLATTINLTGRPITTMTGNAINIGRLVSLAYSLGLNRNPEAWNLPAQEKTMRIKVWWMILIHDWWASLCHGTPPHIHDAHTDVPLPTAGFSTTSSENDGSQGHFIMLCKLTAILGKYLPFVYSINRPNLRSLDCVDHDSTVLEVERVVDSGRFDTGLEPHVLDYKGYLNLKGFILAFKLFLCRLKLNDVARPERPLILPPSRFPEAEEPQKILTQIVNLFCSLSEDDLGAFWLPYTAYTLTSTATFLLRLSISRPPRESARRREMQGQTARLIDRLKFYRDTYGWDIGDICIAQCEGTLEKLVQQRIRSDTQTTANGTQSAKRGKIKKSLFQRSTKHPSEQIITSARQAESSTSTQELMGGGNTSTDVLSTADFLESEQIGLPELPYDLEGADFLREFELPDLWDLFQLDGTGSL